MMILLFLAYWLAADLMVLLALWLTKLAVAYIGPARDTTYDGVETFDGRIDEWGVSGSWRDV